MADPTSRHPSSAAETRRELNYRKSFMREDFSGFELTTVQLANKFITSCRFTDSDMRAATLDGAFVRACDFSAANLQNASLWRTHFAACIFRGTDLRWADLRNARFQKQNTGTETGVCDLTEALLDGAILSGVVYDRSTLWPSGFDPESAGARPANG